MICLSVIFIINTSSHNLRKRNISRHVLYTQVKGIVQHIDFNIQAFFCQRRFEGFCIFGHRLRVCDIVRLADRLITGSVKGCQHKFTVEPIGRTAEIQRNRGCRTGKSIRPSNVIAPAIQTVLIGLLLKYINLSVCSRRITAAGKYNLHILLISCDLTGGDLAL